MDTKDKLYSYLSINIHIYQLFYIYIFIAYMLSVLQNYLTFYLISAFINFPVVNLFFLSMGECDGLDNFAIRFSAYFVIVSVSGHWIDIIQFYIL